MRNKILIVHHDFLKTYINSNVGFFAQYFADKGYHVEFLALEGRIEKDAEFKHNNIIIKSFKGTELKDIKHCGILKYIFKNRKSIKAIWLYPFPGVFKEIIFISFLSGIKTVVKMDSVMSKKKELFLYLGNCFYFLFSAILCESPELAKHFPFLFKRKTILYPNALYLKSLERNNSIYKVDDMLKKEKIILFSGRIFPPKNVDLLIKSMNILVNENNIKDWQLKIVGPIQDRGYFSKLEELVRKYQLTQYISFEGLQVGENYYNYLKKSSILVLPSKKCEGQPNVIVDGMYFGNAIICTSNANINYHIPDERMGFLIDPSVKTLSNTLLKLIKNRELRLDMQERAKKRAEEYFILERTILPLEKKLGL